MTADAAAETRLVLIRHGHSMAQEEEYVGGHDSCRGLSDLGRRQVEALRDRLLRTEELAGATAAYCSILPRAIETATMLKPAIGELEATQECDLCEAHPGEADGLTWEQWRERYAGDVYGKGPYAAWSPGGESWADLVHRVGRKLSQLARDHEGETVVVACHGGVIDASLRTFAHLPLEMQWRSHISNSSITEWAYRDHQRIGYRWTLLRFNDAAHLHDLTN